MEPKPESKLVHEALGIPDDFIAERRRKFAKIVANMILKQNYDKDAAVIDTIDLLGLEQTELNRRLVWAGFMCGAAYVENRPDSIGKPAKLFAGLQK